MPGDITLSYHWDEMGRCTRIHSPHFRETLSYDPLGNLLEKNITDPFGAYNSSYAYDNLNQNILETGLFFKQYDVDSIHNRRKKNEASYSVNCLNQLVNDSDANYSYNLNGARIAKNYTSYVYDALGRLINVKGDEEIFYKYDPFGRRIECKNTSSTTQYLYQFDTEIAAYEKGDLKEFRAIYGQASAFAFELQNELYTPLRNHRGDICVLIGKNTTTYRYDAFGEFFHKGAIDSPWLFSGQRYDKSLNLYHFANREYDPVIGRWLTPDPLGFADGPNLYAYVHNNPLIYIDPYGLSSQNVSFLANSKEFAYGFTRGFADDTSFGATNYLLGNYNNESIYSKLGYYGGTGSSMLAGLMYGGTWVKGLSCMGKGIYNAAKISKSAIATTKNISTTRKVTKLASEGNTAIQQIAKSAKVAKFQSGKKIVPDFIWSEVKTGDKVSRGWVDLRPTLDRIKSGTKYPHRNDGSIFKNREGFLPYQEPNYYREFVHPTPSLKGPGPQRIITGEKGEYFYTPDHYQSFMEIN